MMRFWHDARLLSMIANGMLLVALAGLAWSALGWFANQPWFALRHVQVSAMPGSAMRHVNELALHKAVRSVPLLNFFAIDMKALKERVETVPWVRRAGVRRVWPHTLVVQIEEHRAAAIWEDGRLVSVFGELFTANLDEAEEDGGLPQLSGPPGTEREVIERYVALRQIVAPLELEVNKLSLSPRLAWTAQLDNGTELLMGRDRDLNGAARVPATERVSRWVESYPLVTERLQHLAAIIDLRYPNGYAVRSLEKLAEAFDIDELISESSARDAALTSQKPAARANPRAREKNPAGRNKP